MQSNFNDIPMGLGMALARNLSAMSYFSALPHSEQQRIIEQTHGIQSKQEMRAFVDSLAGGTIGPGGAV